MTSLVSKGYFKDLRVKLLCELMSVTWRTRQYPTPQASCEQIETPADEVCELSDLCKRRTGKVVIRTYTRYIVVA